MNRVALQMLTGDKAKYIGIIFGVTFAAFLIAQQASIFCGLMLMTTSQIQDIEGADIWVMDPGVQFIDDVKPMSENELYRVRGVFEVEWAVRLYKGLARARFEDGTFQQIILLGLDDGTFIGAPREILAGSLADLRQPDAVIMDERGYRYLWPGEPFRLGRTFEMNDRRAVIVGVCKASQTFQTFPIVYTRFSQATQFVPRERKMLSFILAQPADGFAPSVAADRIQRRTGLQAQTRDEFVWTTIRYYMSRTGIPINFGMTVVLGFLVGTAIAGQTFYLFTIDNLRQFGALKAMGLSNRRLVAMILLQALLVGLIGYGLGVGAASIMGVLTKRADRLAFFMPWQVLLVTALAVLLILILSSLVSIRRVLVLEPAIVFRT